MKMKEWIKTQTETKGKRLRLAGGVALTGTALILALTLGTGVRAEKVNLGEGVGRMSFQTETVDGTTIYKVTSAEQMSALGKATTGTEGKIFRLETDLTLDIRSAANGTFQGVFDGNGHVIEISNLQISDSTGYTEGDNSGASSAAVSQGALFGTVSGTVKNVIVDVTAQEASYTRTSDAGVKRDEAKDERNKSIETASSGLNLNIEDTVDELSEGDAKTAYETIRDSASYQTVWLNENWEEAEPGQTTGKLTEYRRYESDDVVSNLLGYSAKDAGQTDSFGIVCGSLAKNGVLSQIRLDGEEVTVRQAGAEHAEYDSEDRRIPHYYYYKVGKKEKIEARALSDETLSLALEKQSTQEKSGASAALGDILSLIVTAPDRVVRTTSAGYTISYTLKIAYGDEKAHDVVLQAGEKGTWKDENGTVLDDGTDTYTVTDVKRAGRTISFTYKGTGTKTNQAMAFTASATAGTPEQRVIVSDSAETILEDGDSAIVASSGNPGVAAEVLTVNVKASVAAGATDEATFTVTLKNTSNVDMSSVVLKNSSSATLTTTAGVTQKNGEITIESLKKGNQKELIFTKKKSSGLLAGTNVSAAFSASAILDDSGQKVTTGEATAQINVTDPTEKPEKQEADTVSEEITGNRLTMSAQAPQNVDTSGKGAAVEYEITLKFPLGETVYLDAPTGGTWGGNVYDDPISGASAGMERHQVKVGRRATSATVTISYPVEGKKTQGFIKSFQALLSDKSYVTKISEFDETVKAVTLFYGKSVDRTQVKSTALKEGDLQITVSADQKASKKDATVGFQLTLSGTEGFKQNDEITVTAAKAGGWGTRLEEARNADKNASYTMTVPTDSDSLNLWFVCSQDGTQGGVETDFLVSRKWEKGTLAAKTEKLSVETYGDTASETRTFGAVTTKLTADQDHMPMNGSVTLTLTLENPKSTGSSSGDAVYVTTDFATLGWAVTKGAWSTESITTNAGEKETYQGQILKQGDSVTLQKTVQESAVTGTGYQESVTLTGIRLVTTDITTYTYEKEVTQNSTVEGTSKRNSMYTAQNLSAGALVGVSSGTIQECQQSVDVTGRTAVLQNQAELFLGGVAGKASGTLENLYQTGSLNIPSVSGSQRVQSGLVAGGAAGSEKAGLRYAIVTEAAQGTDLGVETDDTVKTGSQAIPEESWGDKWKSGTYYTDTASKESYFDLSWLVVDTDTFAYTEPKNETQSGNVTVAVKNPKTGRPLQWEMLYRARKTLEDEELQVYHTDADGVMELEDSGYYQPLSVYATDGYYHYTEKTEGEPEIRYPYTGAEPQFADFAQNPWSVQRQAGSLKDQIILTLVEETGWSVNEDLRITYDIEKNTDPEDWKDALISEGKAAFDFEEEEVTIYAVPLIRDKIYRKLPKATFRAEQRERLPGPTVKSSGYFDGDGKSLTEDFRSGDSYLKGGSLLLEDTLADCSYSYVLSPQELGSGWTDTGENGIRYLTGALDGANWNNAYGGKVSLENTGTWYLYVKVQRTNYQDTVYAYGSFNVTEQVRVTPKIYYDYNNGTGQENTSGIILKDDRLLFEISGNGVLTKLQYQLSDRELVAEEVEKDAWLDYDGTPITITDANRASALYVYMRLKSADESRYGTVSVKIYDFGGTQQEPAVSPRTGVIQTAAEAKAATEIESGTDITIHTSDGAKILYLDSLEFGKTGFSATRYTGSTEGLTDGQEGEGFVWYQAGNRWYQVSTENGVPTLYGNDAKPQFHNQSSGIQTRYLSVLVLQEDTEPVKATVFAYKVREARTVATPEAALVTTCSPSEQNIPMAVVEKDSYISFRTQTPKATLLYVLGTGPVAETPGGDTKVYDSTTGIQVEGEYGGTFYVGVRAVKEGMKSSEVIRFVYTIAEQKQALEPTATPSTTETSPTVVTPGDKILLSSATRGAEIYYTTDGSSPSVSWKEDGTLQVGTGTSRYNASQGITMPLDGEGYYTIRAVSVAVDYKNSKETVFVYAYPETVESPYGNIPSGNVEIGTKLLLKNRTEGAAIYYTISTDGSEPAEPTVSSSVFDQEQPIIIKGETRIKAIAVKNGVKSDVVTLTYSAKPQLGAPTASIDSGAMVSRGTKLKLSAETGAVIYFTTDGSDPTDSSNSAVASGAEVILDGEPGAQITVRAYARKADRSASETVTFTYQISKNAAGVTADVASGTEVSSGSRVNLMTDVTGAEIYYTTDGSSPSAGHGTKGTVVTIQGDSGSTVTVKAVAVLNGDAGTVCTFIYRIKEKPAAPTASPSGGHLTTAVRVELRASAEKIYYTTDGSTPTKSSSLYKEPILVNRTMTLKAIAVSADGEVSDTAVFTYQAAGRAQTPEPSLEPGSTLEPGTVLELTSSTADAFIYYSTDGTDPTLDNLDSMLIYTGEGIPIRRTVTIKAVAYQENMQLSQVGTYSYVVDTVPAAEAKKAEEERLAEESLHDTDASALQREEALAGATYSDVVLREQDYRTVVSASEQALSGDTVLVTEAADYTPASLKNVKQVFGEDYVILSSYDMKLLQNGRQVQPTEEVEIGIPIPERYRNAAVTIVYINEENQITKLPTRRQDGMAYASVTHFSHYALVGTELVGQESREIPWLWILMGVAGLTAISGLIYFLKNRRKDYPNE